MEMANLDRVVRPVFTRPQSHNMAYLVSGLLEQQWLSLLHFGCRDVLDGLPGRLPVGVTRGVLLDHRHPLQHCCPAERGNLSAHYVHKPKDLLPPSFVDRSRRTQKQLYQNRNTIYESS